jgi:hypothetical protein
MSAGAGVSIPTSEASANLNTGWNFVFRGGVNVSRDFWLTSISLITTLVLPMLRWRISGSRLW